MLFSWQGAFKEWLNFEKRAKQWREEAARGWNTLQSDATSLADRSFAEVESLRLRYRVERIDRKVFQAYQAIGKKVSDGWAGEGMISPFTEEERKRESRRIDLLLEEQKKLRGQIQEMEESGGASPEGSSTGEEKNS